MIQLLRKWYIFTSICELILGVEVVALLIADLVVRAGGGHHRGLGLNDLDFLRATDWSMFSLLALLLTRCCLAVAHRLIRAGLVCCTTVEGAIFTRFRFFSTKSYHIFETSFNSPIYYLILIWFLLGNWSPSFDFSHGFPPEHERAKPNSSRLQKNSSPNLPIIPILIFLYLTSLNNKLNIRNIHLFFFCFFYYSRFLISCSQAVAACV